MVSIQILRAVAAIMVVIFHVMNKSLFNGFIDKQYFMPGAAGVDLFFIISGFIMVYITYNKRISFLDFIAKRIIRIFPIYWIITAISLIVYLTLPGVIKWGGEQKISILHSFTLLPVQDAILVAVAWTLRYEILFYLIFSLSLLAGKARYKVCILTLMLLPTLSLLTPKGVYYEFLTNKIILEFAMGMASYFFVKKISQSYFIAIPLGIAALMVLDWKYGYNENARVIMYALPMLVVFVGFTSCESWFSKSKSLLIYIFKRLGDASYSIYLTHFFTIGVASRLCLKIPNGFSNIIFTPFATLLSVIAGLIFYELCEKPITNTIKLRYDSLRQHKIEKVIID